MAVARKRRYRNGSMPAQPNFFHEPIFDFEEDEGKIVGSPPRWHLVKEYVPSSGLLARTAPVLRPFCYFRILDKGQEHHLFRQMNFYKYRAFMTDDMDEATAYAKRADETRNTLTQHNMLLLFSICSKFLAAGGHEFTTEFMDLISDASLWLMNTVRFFDYRRHNKFSTYVTWSIRTNTPRRLARLAAARRQCVNDLQALAEVVDHRRYVDWGDIEKQLADVDQRIATIPDKRIQRLMRLRLGREDGHCWSLADIGREFKTTSENIRQRFNHWCVVLFGREIPKEELKAVEKR